MKRIIILFLVLCVVAGCEYDDPSAQFDKDVDRFEWKIVSVPKECNGDCFVITDKRTDQEFFYYSGVIIELKKQRKGE